MLVISFLQLYGSASMSDKAGTSQKKKDLGTLLMEFLDYYGRRFEFENTGISIINGG
jgi:DNA polymerase sigma